MSRRARGGFSLIEVSVAMAILAASILVLLGALVQARQLDRFSNERTTAASQAQRCYEMILEDARSRTLQDLVDKWTQRNPLPDESPPAIVGLDPLVPPSGVFMTRVVGRVTYRIEVMFPLSMTTPGSQRLDETTIDPTWGLPRDLNGDGDSADAQVPLGDAMILPVRIRVTWTGVRGAQRLDFHTFLTKRTT